MGAPTYTSMGRDELIQLCKRLRKLVKNASPTTWIDESDLEAAREWEHAAAAALAGRELASPKLVDVLREDDEEVEADELSDDDDRVLDIPND